MARWPEGVHKLVFEQLDSTMSEAARYCPGLRGPLWILALEQSAGRGRQGRAWLHEPGNFAATLIWQPAGEIATRALRSFVAALALRDACLAATGGRGEFRLKWPNDVLLNGGKLAGILLESTGPCLLIGVGVNLAAAPASGAVENAVAPPVNLRQETGVTVAPREFLDLLAPAYAAREEQFLSHGFGAIRDDWLAHAAHLGKPLRARLPDREITGIFRTVDEHGQLVLETTGGEHRIAAADIFLDPR